ncbi:hypothetical protein tinsulaeT_33920 [Thalassotalea insulae]|uniref:SGNH/GDSL hydrolase family protein n=1 Tax=Thalassotalea insulae TaxID=2056778 RepID=A0ABQ6GW13_9GAMM|nr:hypothetical protein [Thalassotalea insulae]GLX80052.1 hypothetical protein tinsulaeT_33920 [Thalassotalea insulae]
MKLWKLACLSFLSLLLINCGSSSSSDNSKKTSETIVIDQSPDENLAIPDNTVVSSYQVLLIGNSHVASNDLPALIERFIKLGKPNAKVSVERLSNYNYLDNRINDGVTLEEIERKNWSHVVLQGQKYSQSKSVLYSTREAEKWIYLIKQRGITPILFPEHPQRGSTWEAQYVHDIHLSIKNNQQSCVAPVGLGWNEVLSQLPDLTLHAPDGNHAAYAGSVFTALVFYQVITGELADALPYSDKIKLDNSTQARLGEIASQILDEYQACDY